VKRESRSSKNILITPLGWGLGHAARMIPLALKLKEMNHNITIAGNKDCLALFRKETKGFNLIMFSGFTMRYSRYFPSYVTILVRLPLLIYHSFREHFKIKNLIAENKIDIIISDNRFGCWNNSVKSVYVTHQLRILFPFPFRFIEPLGIAFHRGIIKKYDSCFIPDFPGEINISGDLSHNMILPPNVRYIGLLSRFVSGSNTPKKNKDSIPYITIILSGPEPQKSILRKKLIDLLKLTSLKAFVFEGKPGIENKNEKDIRIISMNHLPLIQMRDIITGSKNIICRAGYTTIMEMMSLKQTALLIPTPGQTEQEYLAGYLSRKGWFSFASQNENNILSLLSDNKSRFPDNLLATGEELLSKALIELSE
jgi:uncharacterized protein (TIGR00661 family)